MRRPTVVGAFGEVRRHTRIGSMGSRCMIATLAIASGVTGCSLAEEARIHGIAEDVEGANHPGILAIRTDSGSVRVSLMSDAQDSDARRLWCDVLLPAGLTMGDTSVLSRSGRWSWQPPMDCADSSDVPSRTRAGR